MPLIWAVPFAQLVICGLIECSSVYWEWDREFDPAVTPHQIVGDDGANRHIVGTAIDRPSMLGELPSHVLASASLRGLRR